MAGGCPGGEFGGVATEFVFDNRIEFADGVQAAFERRFDSGGGCHLCAFGRRAFVERGLELGDAFFSIRRGSQAAWRAG